MFMKRHVFLEKKSKNKFNARKCYHDGIKFDSIKEGNRYLILKDRLSKGEVSNLRVHPKYPIYVNEVKICDVILDFEYLDNVTNKMIYLDVKGLTKKNKFLTTGLSRLKKKLIEANYNITITYI